MSGSTRPEPTCDASIVPPPCVFEGILHFAQTGGGDVRKLTGEFAGTLRLRVGDYRVLFTLDKDVIRILGVRHRSDAYR